MFLPVRMLTEKGKNLRVTQKTKFREELKKRMDKVVNLNDIIIVVVKKTCILQKIFKHKKFQIDYFKINEKKIFKQKNNNSKKL